MRGRKRIARRAREEDRLTRHADDDRIRHHAREHGGHERVGLEVVAEQDLDREERRAERGLEDRRDARGDAGDEQDAPLARRDRQGPRHRRAERAADLHRRPLAAARAARAEREDRRQGLDPDDAPAREAAPLVVRADHRVAAAAPRLGHGVREQARAQRAEGGKNEQHPRSEGGRGGLREQRFPLGAERRVPGELLEAHALDELEPTEEHERHRAGREAHERRVQEHLAEVLEAAGDRLRHDAAQEAPPALEAGLGQGRQRAPDPLQPAAGSGRGAGGVGGVGGVDTLCSQHSAPGRRRFQHPGYVIAVPARWAFCGGHARMRR